MSTNKLSDQVKEAFAKTNSQDFVKEYLGILHGNWSEAKNGQNRAIFSFIFLAFVFELFTRAIISEISLGPFKLTNVSIIHKLLPILLAYYYFEVAAWGKERGIIGSVYYEVIKTCYPSISENKLHTHLSPEGITIFGYKFRKLKNSFLYRLQQIVQVPIILFATLAPIIVGIYAFYQLFNIFGLNDILVWFSLTSYILLLILAYTSFGEMKLE